MNHPRTPLQVVVTGAGRDFGRTLALAFAAQGAEVHLSARDLARAEATRDELRALGHERVHAYACDVSDPVSVRAFAAELAGRTDRVDVLVNNGARWLDGPELTSVTDDDVLDTIASGATGTILVTKHLLPLLRRSDRADLVTMVSVTATSRTDPSSAHPAFYAAKGAQAAFTDILSQRLRPEGIRVLGLYPPDFRNLDPLSPAWDDASHTSEDHLTSRSLVDCILFAVGQPRDCFIRSFHFESLPARTAEA